MERKACKICSSGIHKALNIEDVTIYECRRCKHRMAFVNDSCDRNEKIFSDAYFLDGKGGYTDYHLEQDLLRERGRSYSKILASHQILQGQLLDAGCAAGYMMQGFQDCGWQVTGLESNKTMADFAVNALGLKVVHASLEDCDLNERYDVISLIQLIGHLDNPHDALKKIRKHTRQGGHVLIETWNYRSYTARVMGGMWHEYDPPVVLNWFSPESLDLLFRMHGFSLLGRGKLLKWIKCSHALTLLEYKVQRNPLLKTLCKPFRLIPENLAVPYPSEDLFYAIYRLQDD